MPSTYTNNLGIEKIATGEQSGTWGDSTNINLDLVDQAVNGIVTFQLASSGTTASPNLLPITNGGTSSGKAKYIEITDSGSQLSGQPYVQLTPNDAQKIAYIKNSLTSNSVIIFQGTYDASRDIEIPTGETWAVVFQGGGSTSTVSRLDVADTSSFMQTSGGTFTGAVTFADDIRLRLGVKPDLILYHDSASGDSFIQESGPGNLFIKSNGAGIVFRNSLNLNFASMLESTGEIKLFYNGAGANDQKLATSNTGISVTGTVAASEDVTAVDVTASGDVSASGNVGIGANWTVRQDGSGNLIFATGGTDKMKLDASGNLTVTGNVTAYGTI